METAFAFVKFLVDEQEFRTPWRLALLVCIFGLVLFFTFGAFGVTFYSLRQAWISYYNRMIFVFSISCYERQKCPLNSHWILGCNGSEGRPAAYHML